MQLYLMLPLSPIVETRETEARRKSYQIREVAVAIFGLDSHNNRGRQPSESDGSWKGIYYFCQTTIRFLAALTGFFACLLSVAILTIVLIVISNGSLDLQSSSTITNDTFSSEVMNKLSSYLSNCQKTFLPKAYL